MFFRANITRNNIIQLLLRNRFQWRRVNQQPCIHTFYKNYSINLCLWNKNGVATISIDVDDIKNGRNDVVAMDIPLGHTSFNSLLIIYRNAMKKAINIAA